MNEPKPAEQPESHAADRSRSAEAAAWEPFSAGYEQTVISFTSLERTRNLLISETKLGLVVDIGCGPVGDLTRALASITGVRVFASDFSLPMLREARTRFRAPNVYHVAADNRELPIKSACANTVFSVNSIIPEQRSDADRMFAEVARILAPGGRLVAVLPSFEMSLVARDQWAMPIELDLDGRRERDTSGWQCFYTEADIAALIERHLFRRHRLSRIALETPEEIAHVRTVYAAQLERVPARALQEHPLFEHFLVAEK